MQNLSKHAKSVVGALLLSVFLFVGCKKDDDDPESTPKETVMLKTHASLGSYLTDEDGKTLYFFTKDTKGASVCEGGCLSAWPIFFSEKIVVPEGLAAVDFGTITRSDGTTKQTTYKGWPLYYFAEDLKAGDVVGENVGKVWFVAKPDYTLMLADQASQYMVDMNGKTLYYFQKDEVDKSICTGGCVTNWPLFTAANFVVPSNLNKADFKVITREDGASQATYKGKPLYYWKSDPNRGDINGASIPNWVLATPE